MYLQINNKMMSLPFIKQNTTRSITATTNITHATTIQAIAPPLRPFPSDVLFTADSVELFNVGDVIIVDDDDVLLVVDVIESIDNNVEDDDIGLAGVGPSCRSSGSSSSSSSSSSSRPGSGSGSSDSSKLSCSNLNKNSRCRSGVIYDR